VLTTDQKGNIAELVIAARAIQFGIEVYRPLGEGGRYDLIFELGRNLLRVQCKWATRYEDVVVLRCYSARRNRHGLLRRCYRAGEIDAFAAYCAELDTCYFVPFEVFGERTEVRLRLAPCKNNQHKKIN